MESVFFFFVKFFDEQEYADRFVRGEVFARTLSEFKKSEDNDESGRMDRHEGTIAWLQPGKCQLTVGGMDMSADLTGAASLQPYMFNHLNVFCVHAAHSRDLNLGNLSDIEALRQMLTIPDECLALGEYAVVVRASEFVNRMKTSAHRKGYRIASGLVKYYDPASFHGWLFDGSLQSVFRKQGRYRHQQEYRFAIDRRLSSKDPLVMDIGDIRDTTFQCKSYDLNGMTREMKFATD